MKTLSLLLAITWSQWGGGPRHTGSIDVNAQRFALKLAEHVVDPHVTAKRGEANGALLVHYQTPLSDGNEVFMESIGGTYTGFSNWSSQTWGIRKFVWQEQELAVQWRAESDWFPVPPGAARFEPVFHAALTEERVYMPAAGGTVLEVDRTTGALLRRLGSFGTQLDLTTYVISPLTIDDAGNIYYNALKLQAPNPWGTHEGAWLVKIAPDGTASRASYTTLVTNAPAAGAQCTGEFSGSLPWPPSPNAVAPTVTCGPQRAGLNVTPAVGPDGTIYTVSRAHFNSRWGYLVAVNPDLTPKWSASLRNRFNDGCNVLLPPNGQSGGCRAGTTTGVDPSDNQPGSGAINDNSTSSPVVAPDGTIYYGSYTRYNYSQGHMMRFSESGQFMSAYPFGWDVTPALWEHDGTFSLITKENRYDGVGSYCGGCSPDRVPGNESGYLITQLSPELTREWSFRSTNLTQDRPVGYEWCVNAPAVDNRGVVYVNSEDGHLYAIDQGGTLRERIFLKLVLGAAYTPLSLGADGKIYTQNAGVLFAVGQEPAKKQRAVRR